MLDFKGYSVKYLPLVEFANIFQTSIGMASYEALYGRKCRTPICWNEVGEWKLSSEKLIRVSMEKIQVVRERLKVAQDRQKVMQILDEGI